MKDDRRNHGNDYLWSGAGAADPEIARLERVLGALRYDPRVVRASPSAPIAGGPATMRRGRRHDAGTQRALALAAMLTVAASAAWFAFQRPRPGPEAWALAPTGVATVDRVRVSTPGALAIGRWLETGDDASVELDVADIGSLTVHPRSRLRITESRAGEEHRVQLAHGKIEAFIFAPPRLFFVDTPAAVAVDLGCVYELEVDGRGDGELLVTLGWVMLENGARSVTVPADARCAIRAGSGPGVPRFEDAPAALVDGLARLDANARDADALSAVLDHARPRDRLSLWHLLPRVDAPQRRRVLATMTAIAPLPPGVSADAVVALDRAALEAWWSALDRGW